jgi:putative phosphoesterase
MEKDIPPIVAEVFQDVDLILHAGDIYIPSVLDDLERIAPVLAATGDDDYDLPDTVADKRVKETHILELEGHMLLLIHIQPYNLTPVAGQNEGSSGQHKIPDIVVSGHAHYPMVSRYRGVLYVNPGSPTCVHYQRGLGCVGILDIDTNGADARILDLQQVGTPGYTGGTGFGPR